MSVVAATPAINGVTFDPTSVQGDTIRALQDYGGLRATLFARITTAKIKLQLDVGFGDAVRPAA